MSEVKFVDGLYIKEAVPEFILCKLNIQADRFVQFCKENQNENGYVSIDIKRAQSGSLYAALDTWKPPAQGTDMTPPQYMKEPQRAQQTFQPPEMPPADGLADLDF